MEVGEELLDRYRSLVAGQRLSAYWFGHGSAVFLELGSLVPSRRRDGSPGAPRGDLSLMIEFDWRIESDNAVLVGSADEKSLKDSVLGGLIGEAIRDLSVYGPPYELVVHFAGGRRVRTFMAAAGEPEWAVFVRGVGGDYSRWLSVGDGRVVESSRPSEGTIGTDISSD